MYTLIVKYFGNDQFVEWVTMAYVNSFIYQTVGKTG